MTGVSSSVFPHDKGLYQTICIQSTTFLRSAVGSNLGEEVGTKNTNGEDDEDEGDHQLNERRDDLTNLEIYTTDIDSVFGDTLSSRGSRGKNGGDDTVGQSREEFGDHGSKVDGRSDDDDILCIEHLFVDLETLFLDNLGDTQWILASGARVLGSCFI